MLSCQPVRGETLLAERIPQFDDMVLGLREQWAQRLGDVGQAQAEGLGDPVTVTLQLPLLKIEKRPTIPFDRFNSVTLPTGLR
jgi:hypothetical protein